MNRLKQLFVWLRRICYSRGFGIQSPTDYWLVRYVINEHWPYYQYDSLGAGDDWLRRKLGRLYFRLANWRQPQVITSDDYREYLQAGCRRAVFGEGAELVVMPLDGDWSRRLETLYNKVDERSVLVVEAPCTNKAAWLEIVGDQRTGVTFDLYSCGIVLFDKKRAKKNYMINF